MRAWPRATTSPPSSARSKAPIELRRPIPLHRDDVLVLDEASQLDTADLALITEAARQAGARIIATGDTAQLGAVERRRHVPPPRS